VGSVVRLAALRNVNAFLDGGGNAICPVQETTEGQKTSTAVNESMRFQLCEPLADWLAIYVTPGADGSTMAYTITASD
jgi:hypothetical protein